ncbi:hypothetical protein JW921_04285, partial [Candidatus Fermentibacterales bacterium]|nr:hypothetical protein [Candidatus Fermentibacterales bacterium]
MRPESRWACLLLVCGVVAAGCAYYNTFYNARTSYEQARKLARENPEHPSAPEAELLTSAIYGAGKVISVYPESRWVDDAQLLIGDASLLLGQRSTTGSGTSNFQDAMLAY